MKYHFKTDQGIEFLTQAEADQIAASDGDYHQRDLYQAIERGEFPSWSLKMQIMPFEEARNYRFNPFDLTKVWPHSDYPLIDVGRLTLDRNLTDYHTEMEQAAFEPNNLVPGITLSPDKMLLARGFSYGRAPRPPRRELQADPGQLAEGRGAQLQQGRRHARRQRADPVYAPNSKGGEATASTTAGRLARRRGHGAFGLPLHAEDDDWGQAGTMVREVLDDAARERLVSNVVGHLLDGVGRRGGLHCVARAAPPRTRRSRRRWPRGRYRSPTPGRSASGPTGFRRTAGRTQTRSCSPPRRRGGSAGSGRAGGGDLRPVAARGPGQAAGSGVRGPVGQAGDHIRPAAVLYGDLTPECASIVAAVLDSLSAPAGAEDTRSQAQRYHDGLHEAMQRLVTAGLLPERAGQPVKAWVHVPGRPDAARRQFGLARGMDQPDPRPVDGAPGGGLGRRQ